MYKKFLAIIPIAGVLAIVTPVTTAQAAMSGVLALPAGEVSQKTEIIKVARRGRGFRRGIRRGRGIRRHRGIRRFNRRRGPRIYFGYGAPAYYAYRRARSCRWLRRRARITGSRYWWRRYQNCRYRRYY